MIKEKKFIKYQQRGAYHWQQISQSIFNYNAFVHLRYQQVLKAVPQNKSLKILDIGCGEGVLVWLIYQKTNSPFIVGIDSDASAIKFAHQQLLKRQAKAKFLKASAYKLPFKDNSFDLIVSTEVIEHLSQANKHLAEINRLLKPKGKLIITTPVKLSPVPQDKMHIKEYTPLELKSLLNQYFDKVAVKTSHPAWLKNLYTSTLVKINQYHLNLFRWLVNLIVIIFKWNPFNLTIGQPSQQTAICQNKKLLT